ncbi:MAG TPA: hypothetical protein VHY35_16305 [Stellaceae bacterium]|nr:hypothetical protein [Stellaceae bacterium]
MGGGTDTVLNTATVTTATFGIYDNGTNVTLGNLSYAHAFNLEQGSTLNLGGDTLTLTGTAVATFNNEGTTTPTINGSGLLVTARGSVSNLNNLVLGGTVNWQNSGTVNQTALLTIGDSSSNAATFINENGSVYNLTNDTGIARGAAATSLFVNSTGATFEKTAGAGTSLISVDMTDNGALAIATGIVEFVGPNNSFTGAITGAGQFALGAGSSNTVFSTAAIATGIFGIYDNGTNVILGNVTYSGNFNLEEGATLSLGGHTLTLTAASVATFNNEGTLTPMINGGVLATAHGSVSNVNNLVLAGTANWMNAGTVNQTAQLVIGDGSSNAAMFTNKNGGVYDLTNDSGITRGAAASSQFVNAAGALFAKTAGTGTSQISVNMSDSGTIAVNTGTIEFVGPNNGFFAPISGAGQFALGFGSTNTINNGATITTGTFGIYDNGTNVALAENLSYAHVFNLEEGSILNLGGHTLTLAAGAVDTFNNEGTISPTITGSGTLSTTKGSITNVNNMVLGGTVTWQNAGVVNQTASLTIGDGSSNAAVFTNANGGIYNLTNDGGVARAAAATSQFANTAGSTFEKTAGTGTSSVSVDMTDNGAIVVNTGTVEFVGPNNSFAGAISGAGQFALGGGSTDTIFSTAAITTSTFGIYDNGTNIVLGNLSYAHAFNLEEGAVINLGGHTLKLTGTAVAIFNNEGTLSPTITGSGILASAQGSVSNVNNMVLGGKVNWQNSGTVNETASLTIGDGSSNAAVFTNESGGVYNLTNDGGIARGAAATSLFVNNAGATFEKIGGTGNSSVGAVFTNNGTVAVNTGSFEFQTTVSGSGAFNIATGTELSFDANVQSGSAVNFLSTSGGELILGDSQQFQATVHGFGGSGTDTFDFRDINFNSVNFSLSYAGNTTQGMLSVTDGMHTAHIALAGNYTTANFHAATDHANGTLIVDPHA